MPPRTPADSAQPYFNARFRLRGAVRLSPLAASHPFARRITRSTCNLLESDDLRETARDRVATRKKSGKLIESVVIFTAAIRDVPQCRKNAVAVMSRVRKEDRPEFFLHEARHTFTRRSPGRPHEVLDSCVRCACRRRRTRRLFTQPASGKTPRTVHRSGEQRMARHSEDP